jgi:uncharacterized protein with HEPN domain
MRSRELSYLKDMLNSAKLAQEFVKNTDMQIFESDLMRQAAVTRQLEIIGEAARRISTESQTEIADIPWRQIVGMRNRIIHEYDRLNFERIWQTVQVSLPPLIITLEKIIQSESP